jgi:hypothetical protein
VVEHIIGNDEVGSSILPSSTSYSISLSRSCSGVFAITAIIAMMNPNQKPTKIPVDKITIKLI